MNRRELALKQSRAEKKNPYRNRLLIKDKETKLEATEKTCKSFPALCLSVTQRAGAAPASRLRKVQAGLTARGQWNRSNPTQELITHRKSMTKRRETSS